MMTKFGAQIYLPKAKSKSEIRSLFGFLKSSRCEVAELTAMPTCRLKELAEISKESGVSICSTRMPLERLQNDIDKIADALSVYHCNIVGCGTVPFEFQYKTLDDVKRMAEFLNRISQKFHDRNIKLMYYNRKADYKRIEGRAVIDHLLELTLPRVFVSLDVYLANAHGAIVEEQIDHLGSRLVVLHLKDAKPTLWGLAKTIGAPGDGVLDFKSYLQKATQNGTPYAVIETAHTNRPRETVKRGMKFLNELRAIETEPDKK